MENIKLNLIKILYRWKQDGRLYNFLSQDGRNLYNLTDPNQIQSQEDIDNMPVTTPEEIAFKKDIAQTEEIIK